MKAPVRNQNGWMKRYLEIMKNIELEEYESTYNLIQDLKELEEFIKSNATITCS